MRAVGAELRRAILGGTQSGGAFRRWRGVAVALAAAALVACAGTPPAAPSGSALRLERAVTAGLELYESREYAVAAERFHEAAREAYQLGDASTEKTALTAECTSWLRAQRMTEFATCTERLGKRHRRASRADPGISTLLALGAIAGERPAPPFRVPSNVAPLIRAASHGGDY